VTLHIPTLIIVLAIVQAATLAFSIVLYLTKQVFKGAEVWILGQALVSFGSAVLAFRESFSHYLTIPFSNGSFLAGIMCFLHAVLMFRNKRHFNLAWYLVVPASVIASILLMGQTVNVRAILFSFPAGCIAMAAAYVLLHKPDPDNRPASLLVGIPFALIGLANFIRLPEHIFGKQIMDYYQQGPVSSVVLLASILTSMYLLFAYYMLSGVQFERELRAREAAIQQKNETLTTLNHAKDVFIAAISHDLRGPIGGSARFVKKHFLESGTDPTTRMDAVKILSESLERTHAFLESLLSWAQSQRDDWEPKPVNLDVFQLAGKVISDLESQARDKKIRFALSGREANVFADRFSFELVLRILVSNAIKYSQPNQDVRIDVSPDNAKVQVAVIDHGIGMSKQQLAELFDMENRRSTKGTSGEPGSGMGLILAKSLCDAGGLHLRLDSTPRSGTTATIILPVVL